MNIIRKSIEINYLILHTKSIADTVTENSYNRNPMIIVKQAVTIKNIKIKTVNLFLAALIRCLSSLNAINIKISFLKYFNAKNAYTTIGVNTEPTKMDINEYTFN